MPSKKKRIGSVGIQAGRCLNLLRYHRPLQLWNRVRIRARRRWFSIARARRFVNIANALPLASNPALDLVVQARLDCRRSAGASKSNWPRGHFSFLEQDHDLGSPVNWTLDKTPSVDHLWRFHLHYQDYLLDALDAGESRTAEDAWRVVLEWIDHYAITASRATTDGWHPFCISKRLPNWIVLFRHQPPRLRVNEILGSMVAQARYLSQYQETDLGGNHLLENTRALGMAGSFFAGSESDDWLRQAERVLRSELPEQILPHGEHFERSPMYHAHVLEILLDLRDVTQQRAPNISKLCGEYGIRAAEFLATILHPDGEFPLFGDSVLGDAPPSQVLLARADCVVDHAFPDVRAAGGYWMFRDKDVFVAFDAAPAGPDHLPAHAHSDLLTIELSYRGRRLFVDTGVYDYADSDMRRHCRRTAAHNVIQIDGRDQFDMWSRFRVGYRGWPTELRHARQNGHWWAYATHDAYRRAKVPVVGRWVVCGRGIAWACVDWVSGDGQRQLTNRLHVHPDAKAEIWDDTTIRLSLPGVATLYLHGLAIGQIGITNSWYCPHFGQRQEAVAIEVDAAETLPVAMGWCLSDRENCPARLNRTDVGWRFSLDDAGQIRSWSCDVNQQIVWME